MQSNNIRNFQLGERESALAPDVLPLIREHALQSAGPAFHALANTMPQIVWSTLPDGAHDYFNARWYEFTGVPKGSTDGDGWADIFHPDDQEAAWAQWTHSLATGEPYEVEYRLRHRSGEYRWMIGRALPVLDEDHRIHRWIGTCTDIDEQKAAALQNEILSQELSHRIKNIFAIIAALISLTARSNAAFADAARDLLGRISSLGRAHEFVRPHSKKSRPDTTPITLSRLLSTIFEAYPAYSEGRMGITGPDIAVDSRSATPVALVFHELATNAMKYGSLSHPDGRVSLQLSEAGDDVQLRWLETEGRLEVDRERVAGFGTRLIDLAVRQQLNGDYTRTWNADGLELVMTVKRNRLESI